jgi:uncharacterized protein (TIGR00106 family)
MPLLEISIVPVGTNTPSFSSDVVDAVRLIENRGLKYQVTPTSTVIEGEIPELMGVAQEIHQRTMEGGPSRVITHMTIDERADKEVGIQQQVDTVHQSLQ